MSLVSIFALAVKPCVEKENLKASEISVKTNVLAYFYDGLDF